MQKSAMQKPLSFDVKTSLGYLNRSLAAQLPAVTEKKSWMQLGIKDFPQI